METEKVHPGVSAGVIKTVNWSPAFWGLLLVGDTEIPNAQSAIERSFQERRFIIASRTREPAPVLKPRNRISGFLLDNVLVH
jgi:hypothetical protein